jgi:hypothetical protein
MLRASSCPLIYFDDFDDVKRNRRASGRMKDLADLEQLE